MHYSIVVQKVIHSSPVSSTGLCQPTNSSHAKSEGLGPCAWSAREQTVSGFHMKLDIREMLQGYFQIYRKYRN